MMCHIYLGMLIKDSLLRVIKFYNLQEVFWLIKTYDERSLRNIIIPHHSYFIKYIDTSICQISIKNIKIYQG